VRHGRSFSTDFLILLLEVGVCEELGGRNFTPGGATASEASIPRRRCWLRYPNGHTTAVPFSIQQNRKT
jgi:hypothetical protein